MSTIFERHAGLYLAEVPAKGRGLFCREPIAKGAVIERTAGIFFDKKDADKLEKTPMYDYYFATKFLSEAEAKRLKLDRAKAGCFSFGMLSFCNHGDDPNSSLEKRLEGVVPVFTLRAVRDISADEEIMISYGELWFTPVPLPKSWTAIKQS